MIGIPAMVLETFNAIMRDVTGEPWVILGEVVQFAILAAAVWLLAVGFGKRQGILAGQLARRRERVDADLKSAVEAPARADEAGKQATRVVDEARTSADDTRSAAQREADELEQRVRAEADQEAQRIAEHVDEALASEEARMLEGQRTRLVDTVAQATRSVLSASLSMPEQRRLIEKSVLVAVSAGDSAPSGPKADSAADLRATGDLDERP